MQTEVIGQWLGRRFAIHYDTREKVPANVSTDFTSSVLPSFGGMWRSNLHRSLRFERNEAGSIRGVLAHRGGWSTVSFAAQSNGEFAGPFDRQDRLSRSSDGARWYYRDTTASAVEVYDNDGRLLELVAADGTALRFDYSTSLSARGLPLLARITDHTGRSVTWTYELPVGATAEHRVSKLTAPDGQEVQFGYTSSGHLATVTHPGAFARTFHYESSQHAWALTGVSGENGVRASTFAYDGAGRAQSTEYAGGSGRHQVLYDQAPEWRIVYTVDETEKVVYRDFFWKPPVGARAQLPDGSILDFGFEEINGIARLTRQSQPAGSGCAAATRGIGYDAAGHVQWQDDFNGTRTCYARDGQGRETVRVEGLTGGSAGVDCAAVTAAGVALPAGAVKFSTEWLPGWNKPLRVAEPGRLIDFTYHGHVAAAASGGPATHCAPPAARLPDGEPLPLLCWRREIPTQDADGRQGFAATVEPQAIPREWMWNHDAAGRVLHQSEPGGGGLQLTYHDSTTATARAGDLRSITNAAGHTTTFLSYDALGNWLSLSDPNGVVTTRMLDARQRTLLVDSAGRQESFTYTATGQLAAIHRSMPGQPTVELTQFNYDAAGRLIGIEDNRGNRIQYQLDPAGRRLSENVVDPQGQLRRRISRRFDALGRVQETIGRELQP